MFVNNGAANVNLSSILISSGHLSHALAGTKTAQKIHLGLRVAWEKLRYGNTRAL